MTADVQICYVSSLRFINLIHSSFAPPLPCIALWRLHPLPDLPFLLDTKQSVMQHCVGFWEPEINLLISVELNTEKQVCVFVPLYSCDGKSLLIMIRRRINPGE